MQIIWTATTENVPSDMCALRRFRSACAFAYLCFFMRTTKTLIRLRRCADWLEYSLDVHVRRYVFHVASHIPFVQVILHQLCLFFFFAQVKMVTWRDWFSCRLIINVRQPRLSEKGNQTKHLTRSDGFCVTKSFFMLWQPDLGWI